MAAFAASLPLTAPTTRLNATTRPRRTPRRTRPHLSVAPPPAPPRPPTPETALRSRSVIALRGLSDLGGVTVLHELAARIALPTTLSAVLEADSQLLLGGLIGVWTAACLAERLRVETLSLIRETRQLPTRWDAAFVYTPALEEDEMADAVAWLYALDELEGVRARDLMDAVAASDSPRMRLRLAEALGAYPVPSNVVSSVLHTLLHDSNARVRDAAQTSLAAYHAACAPRYAQEGAVVVQAPAAAQSEEAQLRAVLDRMFAEEPAPEPARYDPLYEAPISNPWILDYIAQRVEHMGFIALSRPDLQQMASASHSEAIDVKAFEAPERVDVPLFDGLRWSELHGLCALALIPAFYEVLAIADGSNLPLRFVGLGWLLTVGGLAAYPQSGMLWRRFQKTMDAYHVDDYRK